MANGSIRILLIDEDAAEAESLKALLAEIPGPEYALQRTATLAEGLELLKDRSFDCILVDLGAAGAGAETVRTVRDRDRDIPMVALAAPGAEELALDLLPLEIQDYLVKGEISSGTLARSIRKAMRRKRVAQALLESEESLRFASEAADIGMWHWDLVQDQLTWSDRCKALFGYPPDFVMNYRFFLDAVHPEDRERIDAAVQQALQDQTEYSVEMRVVLPDRQVRWVMSKGRAYYDERGKPVHMHGIALDITERKRGEEALGVSERKFAKIFSAAPSLIVISTLQEGQILDVNDVALQTLGYQRSEVIGRSVQELDIWDDPTDRDRILKQLKEQGFLRGFETNFKGKNGRLITGLYSGEVLEIGGVICILSLVSDITARKRAEEALVRAKEEWERTFDSVPDFIAILDNDNRVVRVNRAMAQRLGLKPEECVGMPCYTAFHGTDTPPDFCPHLTGALSGKEISEVYEFHLSGHFLVSNTPLLAPDGTQAGVVHVARDISDRKLAEEKIERLNTQLAARAAELEAANRELETFNYSVAHDLRQPLNIIYGYCQAVDLLCGDRLDGQCHRYLQDSFGVVERMNTMIETLLNFSRLGRVELHRERVDLSALAESIASDLRQSQPERGASFRVAEGVVAHGDATLLRNVLENLLGNAWKYTPEDREAVIEFGALERDGTPTYFVRDNGQGFDMAQAGKLFAPFQRLPGSDSRSGFGIGLATVERIVQRHGGTVWAESEPGQGATFYFTLGPAGAEAEAGPDAGGPEGRIQGDR